jgi:hypothetical protein
MIGAVLTKTLVGTPDPDDKDRRLTYWEARAILVELGVIVDDDKE